MKTMIALTMMLALGLLCFAATASATTASCGAGDGGGFLYASCSVTDIPGPLSAVGNCLSVSYDLQPHSCTAS